MKKYEFIEHTADIALKVYGKCYEDLFINSATALFGAVVDLSSQPKKILQRKIETEATIIEDLLVAWLNDLIFFFCTDNFIPVSYSITIKENKGIVKLTGSIAGKTLDIACDKIKMEVKAATYHNLKIEKKKDLLITEIIFDV